MRRARHYFLEQKPKPACTKDPELVTEGQKVFRGGNAVTGLPACAACHSPDGAGITVRYPRWEDIPDYTLAQLKAFKSGERGIDKAGKESTARS